MILRTKRLKQIKKVPFFAKYQFNDFSLHILQLNNTLPRTYAIAGQHAEQVFRYTVTGEICKADNRPATACGDCLDIQIKSARATVCKGLDIAAHIAKDAAAGYAYVIADFSVEYIMTPAEWLEFATEFATVTTESIKNGGSVKTRLKSESKVMTAWLVARLE